MQNTKERFDSLLENPQLDMLLVRANEQAKKTAVSGEDVATITTIDEIDSQVQDLSTKSAHVRSGLVEILTERREKRAEKAAVVVHMYKTACRLLG